MYARRRTHRTKTKIISGVWILLPFVTKAFLETGELTMEKDSKMSSFCGFWGQACLVKVKQLEGDQLFLRLGTLQVWLPSTPGAVSSNKKLTFTLHTVFQPASHREIGELRELAVLWVPLVVHPSVLLPCPLPLPAPCFFQLPLYAFSSQFNWWAWSGDTLPFEAAVGHLCEWLTSGKRGTDACCSLTRMGNCFLERYLRESFSCLVLGRQESKGNDP